MTPADVRREIRRQMDEAGGLKRWAYNVGLSERQARSALEPKTLPSASILKALRLRRVPVPARYAPVDQSGRFCHQQTAD